MCHNTLKAGVLLLATLLCACGESLVELPQPSSPSAGAMEVLAPVDSQDLRSPAGSSCNIEAIDGAPFTPDVMTIPRQLSTVSGWIYPEMGKPRTEAALLWVNTLNGSQWKREIVRWHDRTDVVAALGRNGADGPLPGFSQPADLSQLPAGRYSLVIAFTASGKHYACDVGRKIQLQ